MAFYLQKGLEEGKYQEVGKDLLFFYGPCRLSHLPDVNLYLGEYYFAIGDKEKHQFHLDRAAKIYNKLNDPYGIGRGQIYLIKARDQVGRDNARVIEYCEKGLEISVHEPINILLHYWLFDAYEATGEYVLSKEHKEKYDRICRDNEPYLYQNEGEEFCRIDTDALKTRIPFSEWDGMTMEAQRKA